jgi:uncharacterized LabA/DUF88 family protein
MPIKKDKPNYAFIDAQNLHLGTKDAGFDLDYEKFRVYLKEKYNVEKAYMFIGYIPKYQELYDSMKKKGFLLKFKPVLPAQSKEKQKGDVDADLAFSVMRYYAEFNKAVVVSSDGDFDTVIKYLRAKKKLSVVISPGRKKCSSLLKKAAGGDINYLDEIGEKIQRSAPNEKAPL